MYIMAELKSFLTSGISFFPSFRPSFFLSFVLPSFFLFFFLSFSLFFFLSFFLFSSTLKTEYHLKDFLTPVYFKT